MRRIPQGGPGGVSEPPAGRRTRLTRRGRVLVGLLAVLGLQAIGLGAFRLASSSGKLVALAGADPLRGAAAAPLVLSSPVPSAPAGLPLATVRGLSLRVPAVRVVGVAYHEASLPAALALRPVGRCARNANRTKFAAPPATAGPDYMVMSSRGRPHPATSAVDVAMRPGQHVLAPVSGTVTGVKRYFLYGRYLDYRVALEPAGRPGLRVVLIHLDRVRVHRGDRVVAGLTVMATPRNLPFGSQVNNYVGVGIPHIHVEVKEHDG